MTRRTQRREEGAALLIAMLLLVMMGMLGLAALDTVTLDQQVAAFQNQKRLAFYAAEAGVTEALATLETTGTPVVQPTSLGDAATYPYGQPSYQRDPTGGVADAIKPLDGGGTMEGMNLQTVGDGGSKYQLQFWRIRVLGQGPFGASSRIEVGAAAFRAN
ncbi:MAG: hypothetical protein O7G30_04195 [Proteobacteria bacterium]|nr:hypothetical protein [Pseudomonadota bacterium]